jgi:hypothetical protein
MKRRVCEDEFIDCDNRLVDRVVDRPPRQRAGRNLILN